jgi:hypothetical protein
MFGHTFRGSTWRSAVGLESDRAAFTRYKEIRRRERHYIDWPDPCPPASDLDTHDAQAPVHVPLVLQAG